ncbi:MAG: tellurite resistance TerB family protein [Myxococcales bacterium]|nr:tellurite resistance TerB family protein [Polyangiaceae bacterium]MDW8249691.1 tellurite resistance TerB family protein [Myxococcales bacterium]
MTHRPGLLRRLLGPASSHVVDLGAQNLPLQGQSEPLDEDASTQQFAALVHTVWLIFAADGSLDDQEVAHLLAIIEDLTEGEALAEAIEDLFDAYATLHAEVGVSGSVSLIADILSEPELRESALKLAIGAVVMDQKMSDHEERVLMMLASAFGFSSQQTQDIFHQVESSLAGK